MMLINGMAQNQLSATDRGLQFGDGCFTTARVLNGEVCWLPMHIQRLQQGAERLLLPTIDWALLQHEMTELARQAQQGVLKVILTRGSGGRGYSGAACEQPTRVLSISGYPAHYSLWREQGITLALSPVALARNPLLAGVKHLNRLEQVLIRAHLEQTTADEALVLDTAGQLVECCAANLFWRKGEAVFTPDLSHSGVAGIMRRRIMARLFASRYALHCVSEPLETLRDADEVLICNALMPLVSVNQAHEWTYSSRELYEFMRPHC